MRFINARRGFTLIETVIAMIILTGALIVLTNSWSGSMLAVRKSRQLHSAALLLQKKITEYEILYEGKPLSEVKEEESGDFGDDYPDFSWSMKSKKIKIPDLSAGLTARDGGANEMELMIVKKLTEFIEKSVVEMKVTITQNSKGKVRKPLDYSATTYLVDYGQNLGGLGK